MTEDRHAKKNAQGGAEKPHAMTHAYCAGMDASFDDWVRLTESFRHHIGLMRWDDPSVRAEAKRLSQRLDALNRAHARARVVDDVERRPAFAPSCVAQKGMTLVSRLNAVAQALTRWLPERNHRPG